MNGVEVALLHRLADPRPGDPAWLRAITLAPAAFERELARRRDAPRCPPERLPLDAGQTGRGSADGGGACGLLVTFDDAWRSFRTEALPRLERHGVPAILFVATGFVDGDWPPFERELAARLAGRPDREERFRDLRARWKPLHPVERRRRLAAIEEAGDAPDDEGFLGWEELEELSRHPLVTIGAHSWRHPQLDAQSPWTAAREILRSRRDLARRLGRRPEWLAWPYGAHGGASRGIARAAGFRGAFTTRPGRVDGRGDRFALPRVEWTAP